MAPLHEEQSSEPNQDSQVSVMLSSVIDSEAESASQGVMGTSFRGTAGAVGEDSHVRGCLWSESVFAAAEIGSRQRPGPSNGHQWVRVCGRTVEDVSESRVTGVHSACLLMYAMV